MKKIYIILLLLCSPGIFCQSPIEITVPKITPVSPEAAGIAKYATYPVDYCTGIPAITIPLYDIVSRDLVLPISLSYHASGLKPREESGWVGSGWTLNAVPSVVRTINGLPDDQRNNAYGLFSEEIASSPAILSNFVRIQLKILPNPSPKRS